MPAFRYLANLTVIIACLSPLPASALDEYVRAYSQQPTELELCGKDSELKSSGACKKTDYGALTRKIEQSLQAALSKTPANARPLLKRDQTWFNEMVLSAAEVLPQADDDGEATNAFLDRLRQRAVMLDGMAQGFGRAGVVGRWVNAFGNVTVTAADGSYRLAIDLNAVYGIGSERRMDCRATAELKSGQGTWATGTVLPEETKPAKMEDGKSEPARPVTIKMRRQGESLRIVLGVSEWSDEDRPSCKNMWQITGNFFADGKADAAIAADKADTAFVVPTFDCTKPESATDEEICADPDLADNDQKLNRAWKALLPRLDEATRRALTEDQRSWVKTQTWQYPQFLHPAWEKQSSFMHFTSDARDKLDRLQKERIAMLDGFDDKRTGLIGVWLRRDVHAPARCFDQSSDAQPRALCHASNVTPGGAASSHEMSMSRFGIGWRWGSDLVESAFWMPRTWNRRVEGRMVSVGLKCKRQATVSEASHPVFAAISGCPTGSGRIRS